MKKIEKYILLTGNEHKAFLSTDLMEVTYVNDSEETSMYDGYLDISGHKDYTEYYLRVVVGQYIIDDKVLMLYDYSPQYTSYFEFRSKHLPHVRATLKKLAEYTGSGLCLQKEGAMNLIEFSEKGGDYHKIYFSLNNSYKNPVRLKIMPATVIFAEKTIFKTSKLSCDELPYGCKVKIGYSEGLSQCEDFISLMIPYSQDNTLKESGFHEKVIELGNESSSLSDITIFNPNRTSFYIERASIYDLLYSKILEHFNLDNNFLSEGIKRYSAKNIITREWLECFCEKYNNGKKLPIHIDLGGEGEIVTGTENIVGTFCISGFENAININGQANSSQSRGGLAEEIIPHLILMPSWNEKFPFENGTIDYLTMQSIPITLPCSLKIKDEDVIVNKKEYDEIVRCISDRGKISIWCQNITTGAGENAARLAKEFIDEFSKLKKHYGFPEASAVQNWELKNSNRYACFYSYFPSQELEEICTYTVIPVKINYEEISFLDSKGSIRLDFEFWR